MPPRTRLKFLAPPALPPFCTYGGFLNGQIARGDYDKVAALLRADHPFTASFYLNSPGGDVEEALRIGRLFREYLIDTVAPLRQSDGGAILLLQETSRMSQPRKLRGTCASACALIWFGGVNRSGTVGLHRPRITDPEFKGLPAAEASAAYRQLLNRVTAYLENMEVPKSIIESMISTSSSDISWVDSEDDGLEQPPSIAEWAGASCPGDTLASIARKFGHPLTPQQYDMGGKKLKCDLLLFQDRRSRLSRPGVDQTLPLFDEMPGPVFTSSYAGSFVRGVAEAAVPTIGGLSTAIGTGALIGSAFAPGPGTVIGSISGGVLAGIGAGWLLQNAQEWALGQMALRDGTGMFSRTQEFADGIQHGLARRIGSFCRRLLHYPFGAVFGVVAYFELGCSSQLFGFCSSLSKTGANFRKFSWLLNLLRVRAQWRSRRGHIRAG